MIGSKIVLGALDRISGAEALGIARLQLVEIGARYVLQRNIERRGRLRQTLLINTSLLSSAGLSVVIARR